MGLFGLWLVLVGSSCISAEVATPTLPTLRADLLRAQELVRLTGKARQALTLPELLDALRGLDLIKLHVFNTSVALDVTTLRKDTLGEVESLELLAKRLVETLQVSVDEAERLKSMVNRSQHLTYLTSRTGPCRKRSRASTWLAQLRPKLPKRLEEVNSLQRLLQTMNQHVKRIREEALMGDVALNASVKLHEEAAEHAQKARHEYDSALKALTRVNRLVKDQIFTLEVESPETPEVQRVHNGSHWASLMQIDDVPLATPGYQKDQKGAKKSTPCEHEAPPRHTLGTADSKPVPVAAQHPLPPTGPPVTSTTAASVVTTTQSTSAKVAESDPSPDMPRIFIPGTREPEMEKIHTPSTTVTSTTSTTSHIPSPTPPTTPPPSVTDHLEYVMDETLEALMTERHRLIKIILNINRDIVRADNRSAGLLKARLVAEDAAVQLRRADENHGKAVALVERQLNATQQKMQSLRGQIRIFTAAVKRLSGCLDPEEKEKRQPFLQQLKEESRKIAEEEETLTGQIGRAHV